MAGSYSPEQRKLRAQLAAHTRWLKDRERRAAEHAAKIDETRAALEDEK